MVSNKGIYSSRSFWPLLGAITVATRGNKSRTGQRMCASWSDFRFGVTDHIKPRHIGSRCQSRARALNVSAKVLCVGEGYFFFFLPVFFFAFFAFLAMLPSAIPKLVQCKSTSTCISTEYTTITNLILRASKKVNGDHTTARCEWTTSLTMSSARYVDTACRPARNIRTEIDMEFAPLGKAAWSCTNFARSYSVRLRFHSTSR